MTTLDPADLPAKPSGEELAAVLRALVVELEQHPVVEVQHYLPALRAAASHLLFHESIINKTLATLWREANHRAMLDWRANAERWRILHQALERLASAEAMHHPASGPQPAGNPLWPELQARVRYAQEALRDVQEP